MVSTVVVRSGTASLRAAEFWIPIAIASSRASASAMRALNGVSVAAAMTRATPTRASSAAVAARRWTARSPPTRLVSTPPSAAPIRQPASANSEELSENPGAPTRANPANTTLPVMLATKTRPSARMDTASTRPVTSVSASSSSGSGPHPGPVAVRQSRPGRPAAIARPAAPPAALPGRGSAPCSPPSAAAGIRHLPVLILLYLPRSYRPPSSHLSVSAVL